MENMHTAMKSDLKCSRHSVEKFFGWFVCVKWSGILGGYRKIAKLM